MLELSQRGQIFPAYPTENNLVYMAAELFRSKTGFCADIAVELVKRIPPCSGLGGGSSDAAAALLAMNELVEPEKKLSPEILLDLAAQLGSDIPFFIEIAREGQERSTARAVGGRGEILRFLPQPPPLGVLLAFPGFASHTKAAYSLLDQWRAEKTTNHPDSVPFTIDSLVAPETWNCTNDFQALFLNHGTDQEKNAYRVILEDLTRAGARVTGLSGSGSACFGIFSGPEEAEQAKKALDRAFYVLQSTFFLQYI